jgi:hypothetical protein
MVKIADCIRCDGPLRTANHGSARLARNCRLFRRTRPRHSTIGSSLGVSRLPSKSGPCPQASLTRHAVRGSLRQSGMKLAIRLRLGAHWRLSAYRENRPCRLPAAERPRRDRRAARAHAKTPWARHIHFARGETPRPGLRRPGTFGRSPRVLGAIGMRPDRVDERFERSAANRSG